MKHHDTELDEDNFKKELHQPNKSYGNRCLVIIDGLDELEGWDEVVKEHTEKGKKAKSNIVECKSVPELIYNLVFGKMKEKLELLLTSRPIESITQSEITKALYALCFNEDAIDECSFALCQKEGKDRGKLMETIKVHCPNLYYICVVPLNCVLLCSRVLKDRDSIKSLTDLTAGKTLSMVVRMYLRQNRNNSYAQWHNWLLSNSF